MSDQPYVVRSAAIHDFHATHTHMSLPSLLWLRLRILRCPNCPTVGGSCGSLFSDRSSVRKLTFSCSKSCGNYNTTCMTTIWVQTISDSVPSCPPYLPSPSGGQGVSPISPFAQDVSVSVCFYLFDVFYIAR